MHGLAPEVVRLRPEIQAVKSSVIVGNLRLLYFGGRRSKYMNRLSIPVLFSMACGRVLATPGDAAVLDGTPPDAPSMTVKVTALTSAGDGQPDLAARMIFQDIDGNVAFDGLVDAAGKIEAPLPTGGSVTEVRTVLDTPTAARAELTTIAGVKPGDDLTFGLKAPPIVTTQGAPTTMIASFTPVPGATDHRFFTTCGTVSAGATSPVTLTFRDSCHGATFDLVVVASGGTISVPKFVKLENINYQSGQSFTVPDLYSTMGIFTVNARNVPAQISNLTVTRSSLLDSVPVATQTVNAGDPASGSVATMVPFAAGVGSRSEVSLVLSRPDSVGLQQHSLHSAMLGTSVEVDLALQQVPWLTDLAVTSSGVHWTTSVPGDPPDGMLVTWEGEWTHDGKTTSIEWRLAQPASATGITLPRLPAAYASLDPQAQVVPVSPEMAAVSMVDYDVITGYAEFRQQPEVLTTPLIGFMGAFVGLPYQRRMFFANVIAQ